MTNEITLGNDCYDNPTVGDRVRTLTENYKYSFAGRYESLGEYVMFGRVTDSNLDHDGDVVVELVDAPNAQLEGEEAYFDPEHTEVVERADD